MSANLLRALVAIIFLAVAAKALADDPGDWAQAVLWAALGITFFFCLPGREGRRDG